MYLIDNLVPDRGKSELTQSLARVGVVAVVLLYLLIAVLMGHEFEGRDQVTWITAALLLYAAGLSISVRLYPAPLVWRRALAIVIDTGALSFVFYLAGPLAGLFYPVYFWVIVSNGSRFGINYLLAATAIAVAGISAAMIYSDYWSQHIALATGLVIGLIVLPLLYAIMLRELQTARDELSNQLEYNAFTATHDTLTSLPNRYLFMDRLQQAIDRAQRNKNRFAILYVDVDAFTEINETLGHATGDALLKNIASRLRTTLRGTDSAARFGNDEFVLLLSDLMTRYNAHQAAQRITQVLFRTPFIIEGQEFNITSSIGISIFPDDADDIDSIIKCAESSMDGVRKEGGNDFRPFSQINPV